MAGAFALSMATPLTTYAAPVALQFDPTGTGNAGSAVSVSTIDQTVGNALALNGNTAVNNFLANKVDQGNRDTGFTLYYQANLGTLLDANADIVYTNGTNGGKFFTFAAGFNEKVAGAEAYPGTSAFTLVDSGTNYFNMYASNAKGNNLTGTGFITNDLILSGKLTAINSSNFQITNTNPVSLDQAGDDNDWSTLGPGGVNQTTVTGAGSSDFEIQINFADPNYFLNATPLVNDKILWSFFNNSQIDPFKQVDPSKCFNTPGNVCDGVGGGIASVGTLGQINGNLNPTAGDLGPNFMFQADGNQSFATRVPEPASIALIGLGLSLIGFFNRRRYTA